MTDLDVVLGFDREADKLATRLLKHHAKRGSILGPSGTGKTHLAQSVAAKFANAGFSVVWLRGDEGRKGESFYPMIAALRPGTSDRVMSKGAEILKGLAEDFLPKGKATAKALISLIPHADEDSSPKFTVGGALEFSSLLARLI